MQNTLEQREAELQQLLRVRAGFNEAAIVTTLDLPKMLDRPALVEELIGIFKDPAKPSDYRGAVAMTLDDIARRVPTVEEPAVESTLGPAETTGAISPLPGEVNGVGAEIRPAAMPVSE